MKSYSIPTEDDGLKVITSAEQIKSKLERLMRSSGLLGLHPAEGSRFLSSRLIHMPATGNSYMVVAAHGENTPIRYEPGTTLEFSAEIDGSQTFWQGEVRSVREIDEVISKAERKEGNIRGPLGYVLSMPSQMTYIHRRDSYRAGFFLREGIWATLTRGEEDPIPDLELFDLSQTGISFFVIGRALDLRIDVGDEFKCRVTQGSDMTTVNVKVVWLRSTNDGRGTRVGCQILENPTRRHNDVLARITMKLQQDKRKEELERGYSF